MSGKRANKQVKRASAGSEKTEEESAEQLLSA